MIADRNPNVRELLRRELTAEGYQVLLARNGQEVLKGVEDHEGLDLLVVDLDLPYAGDSDILEALRKQIPALPVVVHTFLPEYINHPATLNSVALVEKEGNSIDRIKDVILEVLGKTRSGSPGTAEKDQSKA